MELNPWTIALQIINFLVLVWLLARFFYHPALRLLEERRRRERAALEEARRLATEAQQERAALREARARLVRERQELRARVLAETEAQRRHILEEARAELARERDAFRRELAHERRRALEEMRGELADLFALFARRIAERLRSPALDEAFFRVLMDNLRASGSLPAAAGRVTVLRCAAAPDDIRTRLYREALTSLTGAESEVPIRTDPGLLAGVALEAPHWRASFTLSDVTHRVRDELFGAAALH